MLRSSSVTGSAPTTSSALITEAGSMAPSRLTMAPNGKDQTMRIRLSLLSAVVLLTLTCGTGANAENYPWCAQYSGDAGGGRNCGFVSWQQCLATVSGIGGFCWQNPMFRPEYGMYGPEEGPLPHNPRRHRHR
jgi:uncharacterized protein DUF3551